MFDTVLLVVRSWDLRKAFIMNGGGVEDWISEWTLHFITFCCKESFFRLINIYSTVLQHSPLISQILSELWWIRKLLRLCDTIFSVKWADWAPTQPERRFGAESWHRWISSETRRRKWLIRMRRAHTAFGHLLDCLCLLSVRHWHLGNDLGCLHKSLFFFNNCFLVLCNELILLVISLCTWL